MADWVRRSPQRFCDTNPSAAECVTRTTQIVEPTPDVQDGNTGGATQVVTSPAEVPTDAATVVMMTSTNLDGPVWTSSFLAVASHEVTADRTTSVMATSARATVRATITDAPQAQSANGSSNSGAVSKGAVAGIAIGTCIIGAVIAFIAAWVLFKRRDKKFMEKTCPSGYPIYADSSPELVMVQKSAVNGGPYVQVSQTQMRTPVPVPARVPVVSPQSVNDALTGILPPEASEHEVGTRVSVLFTEVKRHVDTYYRDVHASLTPSMDSDLESFGKDVNMLELLQNCSHPTIALKHALVAFILSITGPRRDASEQTLWPSELSSFMRPQDSGGPSDICRMVRS